MEAGGKAAKGVVPLRERAMTKPETEDTPKQANKAVPKSKPPQAGDLAPLKTTAGRQGERGESPMRRTGVPRGEF